ncbi:hypothetical protein [Acidovorax sp. PRC11]|uniref:hypothetical protein n=1 Tax=Acidovorax sp. PRC11 TaxID=2962592 RepID=UPI0028816D8E|nr:hypothetical protein [Acidovorax sp. PRC11]MDT0136619.1 hypothetical protein [Acidovorax sp. PRC11]
MEQALSRFLECAEFFLALPGHGNLEVHGKPLRQSTEGRSRAVKGMRGMLNRRLACFFRSLSLCRSNLKDTAAIGNWGGPGHARRKSAWKRAATLPCKKGAEGRIPRWDAT